MAKEIAIDCSYSELRTIDELKPHPDNPNFHPDEQIDRLAKLIKYQGFRHPIIVSENSGYVVAGHGRIEAAKKLGMLKVPVDYQSFESDEAEYAFLVSDNAISLWAELNEAAIKLKALNFGDDFDGDWLGIEGFKLDLPTDIGETENDSIYTDKIQIPIYTPKGERPMESELYDMTKTKELIDQVRKQADLPQEVQEFLINAAQRHTIFDYAKIAEYYCHATPEIKDLMERSALVIIDFNKALENGFVSMSKNLAEAFKNEQQPE